MKTMVYGFVNFQPAQIVIRDEPISDENTVSLRGTLLVNSKILLILTHLFF